jgi:chorismate dehydratase
MTMSEKVLRLGVVPYLNVAPIVHALEGVPGIELVRDVPARLLARLRAGEIDAGTIPSIDYAEGGLEIVPGIAIASRGAVRSVRLVHRGPLAEARRVAVDTSSHTSVALLKVLADGIFAGTPEYVAQDPDPAVMLQSADAALVIGDVALFKAEGLPYVDLGQRWTERTGLPFVYAFWASAPGRLRAADVARLRDSLARGLRAIPDIASAYNGVGAGRSPECESYLRECVTYRLGRDERLGLAEFYRLCHAKGLIARIPELLFHAHS